MLWRTILQVTPRLVGQHLDRSLPTIANTPQSASSLVLLRRSPAVQSLLTTRLSTFLPSLSSLLRESIWWAVPKRKHTRSRKRKKTTVQKRIPLKKNIVFDPQTGEVTLQHKLPHNWREYLPKLD
ncbi:ribosomal protein bL32 family protein [Nitzschia inconspicua]|uniref:Ribosomal protein bL32 family protein n=1 Tax=Nitzschia inconspicua TaxID=303405 RepID=A0A9K3PBS4_9STRA|nr:ribosomal protein bL32 family protein [Nitzschia inconspicua]